MKNFLFFAVAAVGLSLGNQSVQARSWRIHSNANVKPDFTSINAAMGSSNVLPGDTLYLEPGCVLNSQTINKKVVIIGPGYRFTDGTSSPANLNGDTKINGSGVKIEGCCISNLAPVNLKCSDLTVERCEITVLSHDGQNSTYRSCLITGTDPNYYKINFKNSSGTIVSNCIFLNIVRGLSSGQFTNNIIVASSTSEKGVLQEITNSIISNNIIINKRTDYTLDANQNPLFYKNYTIETNTLGSGNTITNNVLSTDAEHAFNDYPNNKFIGATPADIFVMEGIGEEIYRLKEGSPAIGYGTGGYDCGVFSGAFPYVLSGRPRYIPYIYDAVIPNQPTDGKLNVTLKIKSQNE